MAGRNKVNSMASNKYCYLVGYSLNRYISTMNISLEPKRVIMLKLCSFHTILVTFYYKTDIACLIISVKVLHFNRHEMKNILYDAWRHEKKQVTWLLLQNVKVHLYFFTHRWWQGHVQQASLKSWNMFLTMSSWKSTPSFLSFNER